MTDDLHDLDTLAAEATPGKWTARKSRIPGYRSVIEAGDVRNGPGWSTCVDIHLDDALYIAAANPTRIRALIAEVRALRAKDNARHMYDGELAR